MSKIAVELSQDDVSIKIDNEGGDIHLYTAATVEKMNGGSLTFEDMMKIKKDESHPDYVKVKQLRDLSKAVRYSSFNLGGAARLQGTCEKAGLSFTKKQCKEAIDAWRVVHKPIYKFQMDKLFLANSVSVLKKYYVEGKGMVPISMPFGYIRNAVNGRVFLPKYPSMWGVDKPAMAYKEASKLETDEQCNAYEEWIEYNQLRDSKTKQVNASDCMSFLWMSVEAYIMNQAMIRIHKTFRANKQWGAYISVFAHD